MKTFFINDVSGFRILHSAFLTTSNIKKQIAWTLPSHFGSEFRPFMHDKQTVVQTYNRWFALKKMMTVCMLVVLVQFLNGIFKIHNEKLIAI